MKKLIYLTALFLGVVSCSDFLDIDDATKISNDKIFSTIEGAREAINGVYYQLGDGDYYGKNLMIVPSIKGGDLKINDITFENPMSYDYLPSYHFSHLREDDFTDNIYKSIYEIIYGVNNIINSVDGILDASQEEKVQLIAEAKALRALAHFDLTRFFAQPYVFTPNGQHMGIPYLKANITYEDKVKRDLLYKNYEDIIADLTDAELNIGTAINQEGAKSSRAYMSKVAVQALLARVYLYKNDWDNAREYATKVIESGSASLLGNDQIVDSYNVNEPNDEDLFVVDKSGRSDGAPLSSILGVRIERTSKYMLVSNDLLSLYDEDDVRLQLFEEQLGITLSSKYKEFVGGHDHYIPVVRLAEMYLIRAEASLNLPVSDEVQARADLDIIRKRANPAAENVQLSGDVLREELFNERRRELAFEGHLFFDIARMGRDVRRVDCNAEINKDLDYPDYRYVLPIPDEAIEYNDKMIQNPNY